MRIRQTVLAWSLLLGTATLGTSILRQEVTVDSTELNSGASEVDPDDPFVRMEQQLIDSENLRQAHEEWRLYWMTQPSRVPPYRIHGGVAPSSSSI